MSAILFGSISTIADTSELQRESFNQAFREHGLDWDWDREKYVTLLDKSGGAQRITDYASSVGQSVDAQAIHRTKSTIFQKSLGEATIAPRPGVAESLRDARSEGVKTALVTTTSRDNITALIDALSPHIRATDFDSIVDSTNVEQPKPDKASYSFALESMGEDAANCVAIEDNPDGVAAATSAGVTCIAFPNANTAGQDFGRADRQVDRVDLQDLKLSIGNA